LGSEYMIEERPSGFPVHILPASGRGSATCPVCGNGRITTVGEPEVSRQAMSLLDTDHQVVRCNECEFYFVVPEISFEDDDWARLYGEEYFEEMQPWWARKRSQDRKRQLDWLREFSLAQIEEFLDVGCGEGHVLVEALARGWHPHGIDISDNRMDAARDGRIAFSRGSIFEAGLPAGFFDAAYLNSVLEHVTDPKALLSEAGRVLKSGGLLFLGVPNEDCLYNDAKRVFLRTKGKGKVSARLSPFKHPYHVSGFTRKSLATVLDETGFDPVRFRNFAGEYEWRKYRLFSRPCLVHLLMLPVHLVAIPLGRRVYFEIVARKR
jgi:SAM-dependent methyltransferase